MVDRTVAVQVLGLLDMVRCEVREVRREMTELALMVELVDLAEEWGQ